MLLLGGNGWKTSGTFSFLAWWKMRKNWRNCFRPGLCLSSREQPFFLNSIRTCWQTINIALKLWNLDKAHFLNFHPDSCHCNFSGIGASHDSCGGVIAYLLTSSMSMTPKFLLEPLIIMITGWVHTVKLKHCKKPLESLMFQKRKFLWKEVVFMLVVYVS